MELLKHYYNNLPCHYSGNNPTTARWYKLFKTNNNTWVKEIRINDPNFDGYDIDTLKKFIEKFNFIAKPISLEYDSDTKIFKYELRDYSDTKPVINLPYFEQITVFKNIIQMIQNCMTYSQQLGYTKIFCHSDLSLHNILLVNDEIIFIDLDSFEWMSPNSFRKFFTKTILEFWNSLQHGDWESGYEFLRTKRKPIHRNSRKKKLHHIFE